MMRWAAEKAGVSADWTGFVSTLVSLVFLLGGVFLAAGSYSTKIDMSEDTITEMREDIKGLHQEISALSVQISRLNGTMEIIVQQKEGENNARRR